MSLTINDLLVYIIPAERVSVNAMGFGVIDSDRTLANPKMLFSCEWGKVKRIDAPWIFASVVKLPTHWDGTDYFKIGEPMGQL